MDNNRMNYKITILSFFLIVPFLSACGPSYTTKNEYVPPTSTAALSCLQSCDVKRNSCQNTCNIKSQVCKNKAAQTARMTLPARLTDYTHQLELYTAEQDRYYTDKRDRKRELERLEMDYDVYSQRCAKDKHYCDRKKEIKRELRDLKYSTVKSPTRPNKPTIETETQRHQASCTTDCGCRSLYDSCYTSCGGRIVPRRICVSNCPK